jgi:DNA-binding helix-hairpin-helix protein with protein kinase domain
MGIFTTSSGSQLTATRQLGRGGEGNVFEVHGHPELVAKILHPRSRSGIKENKLGIMLQRPPQDAALLLRPPHVSICWPRDLLYENRQFAGFTMQKVRSSATIFSAYNPKQRAINFPKADWRFSHRVAYNLAQAFTGLHSQGYVIGDVNQRNIHVFPNALVTLIDTDSLQVPDGKGGVFLCEVGVPDFTPPELLKSNLGNQARQPHHDNFGLAVLVFMLLMEGFHPFMGAPANPNVPMPDNMIMHCIKGGVFPYVHLSTCKPPLFAPELDMLHPRLRALFILAFVDGHRQPAARPTASQWALALREAEKDLVPCPHNPSHWFSRHYLNKK